jgi:hypothetical protein
MLESWKLGHFLKLRSHPVLRPFGACHVSISITQGVALGWLVSGLWPSAAVHFKTL